MPASTKITLTAGGSAEMTETSRGVEMTIFDAKGRQRVTVETALHPVTDRRSNAQKRAAVMALLVYKKWRDRTDNFIAKACGVSNHFVKKVRKQMGHHTTTGTRK
ncbi:MAG TPA: hypothetical protein VG826_29495 [Pirellulales bacterium]|nr:hypothetical protein [Pirellulales bacterium]